MSKKILNALEEIEYWLETYANKTVFDTFPEQALREALKEMQCIHAERWVEDKEWRCLSCGKEGFFIPLQKQDAPITKAKGAA